MQINKTKVEIRMAEQGLTRLAVSKRSGLTPNTISMILKRRNARPQTIYKLAKGLNVNVRDIIEEEGKQ